MDSEKISMVMQNWLHCLRRQDGKAEHRHARCESCDNRGCWTVSEMEEAVRAVLTALAVSKTKREYLHSDN